MSEVAMRDKDWWEKYSYHKVWCNDLCPLVPRWHYRKGNEYNANNWSLHWLLFSVWSMEHFSFGVDVGIAPNEIYVGAILPYLRIVIGIRNVYSERMWKIQSFLQRKPAIKRKENE